MTRRWHAMPFGAEHAGGRTRFRLWAPACARVDLVLDEGRSRRAMQAMPDGWHEAIADDVLPGALYAFAVDDGDPVPDPASRCNPRDALGPSMVVDPQAFAWPDGDWRGRPWHEAVVYELHVGTFTPEGTFDAAIEKLPHLAALGITAVELMPVADFPGRRNWGYDGVLLFAPDAAYGPPEALKRFVAACHAHGLMALLDVVYNHFGPEGNMLPRYAPRFFDGSRRTPWGAAINVCGEGSRPVRDFFVHNALYWIEEYHFDGLRLDAIHAIEDDSARHLVLEIAERSAAGPGRSRHVHLVLENDRNEARLLRSEPAHASAQWNDDWHHAAHVLVTGERDGYYVDYAEQPAGHLARALAEGFAYQGEPSAHRDGERRGEVSRALPHHAFVAFLQNHDQVGNRALGERLSAIAPPEALRLATAILLLAPSVPMIFMGEEFAEDAPFLFFCDFAGDLARAVREGRREEFARFERFRDPATRDAIPDPNAEATFLASKLRWGSIDEPRHAAALAHVRKLLALRHEIVIPRIAIGRCEARHAVHGEAGIAVDWMWDASILSLRANLGPEPCRLPAPGGRVIHAEGGPVAHETWAPWSGTWTLHA